MHKPATFAETFIVINIIGRFSVKLTYIATKARFRHISSFKDLLYGRVQFWPIIITVQSFLGHEELDKGSQKILYPDHSILPEA